VEVEVEVEAAAEEEVEEEVAEAESPQDHLQAHLHTQGSWEATHQKSFMATEKKASHSCSIFSSIEE